MNTSLPGTLQAGDTWAWDATVNDYPSDTWTLKFVLHLRGSASRIEITATAAAEGGDNYDVEVAAVYTKDYPQGTYDWTAYVEKGSGGSRERYTVSDDGGTVRILADLETADASTDTRTDAQKILDAIDVAILQLAPSGTAILSINGRSVTYKRSEELTRLRAYYSGIVSKQRGGSPLVRAQFGSA